MLMSIMISKMCLKTCEAQHISKLWITVESFNSKQLKKLKQRILFFPRSFACIYIVNKLISRGVVYGVGVRIITSCFIPTSTSELYDMMHVMTCDLYILVLMEPK